VDRVNQRRISRPYPRPTVGRVSGPRIRVLGPIGVEFGGAPARLSKSRHREILGILVAAHGRVTSTARLIDDLWDEPPPGAVGAVQTFVGELRRILEPGRLPRAPPAVLVTVGDGYALHLASDAVDLWHVERALRESVNAAPETTDLLLTAALHEWTGPLFEEFNERTWAQPVIERLAAQRVDAVERLADARLALGRADAVIALLDPHVVEYPWREAGWRLLALALYRSGRQGEALAVLRRGRTHLANDLGLDPGRRLADLERGILHHDPALELPDRSGSILLQTASAHARTGPRAQLEGASALLPGLAVSGGVAFAQDQRLAAITAAEELGDPTLTAQVIGGFDVPGIWTRSDDPVQSATVVGAALRALATLPSDGTGRLRAQLLATVAMESRGTATRGGEACEAERIARTLGDARLQCFAISARYMQCFAEAGMAGARRSIAEALLAVAVHAELPTFEIQGRLMRMQALCALDDVEAASLDAEAVDVLAAQHERPLATVFTTWFRWTFKGGTELPPPAPEMPGFDNGITALSQLTAAIRAGDAPPDGDFGPYENWVRPLLLARLGRRQEADAALDALPDPPPDLLLEVLWCLVGHAAIEMNHASAARRAHEALLPAITERAAGSAVVDLSRIDAVVAKLTRVGHWP